MVIFPVVVFTSNTVGVKTCTLSIAHHQSLPALSRPNSIIALLAPDRIIQIHHHGLIGGIVLEECAGRI